MELGTLGGHPIAGSYRAGLLVMYRRRRLGKGAVDIETHIPDGVRVRLVPVDNVHRLALTFGTLLSSQGADAHLGWPLGRSRGNPGNATRCGSRCQPPVPASPWSLFDSRCRRSDLHTREQVPDLNGGASEEIDRFARDSRLDPRRPSGRTRKVTGPEPPRQPAAGAAPASVLPDSGSSPLSGLLRDPPGARRADSRPIRNPEQSVSCPSDERRPQRAFPGARRTAPLAGSVPGRARGR